MKLQNANLSWKENQPHSDLFDDIYFNPADGAAETRHVFIDGNQLLTRLTSWQRPVFTIAETGFGTGANFLHTLAFIEQHALQIERLHFISTELFPLHKKDLARALEQSFPDNPYAKQLIAQFPPLQPGMHRINFGDRYTLTLCIGDAAAAFAQLDTKVNAWFLDGFAPAKNPDMWRDELFAEMARLSPPDTSVATFTAAGFVRRGLEAAGFRMRKQAGFDHKREMLTGIKTACPLQQREKPWFAAPKPDKPKHAAVIGAGLAGITTAYALARRGISVAIYDQASDICTQASGNRQGALYAKPPVAPTVAGQFHLCGLAESIRWLNTLNLFDNVQGAQCGVLQLATHEKEQQRQQQLIDADHYSPEILIGVDAQQASQLANTEINYPGIFFPNAGWVYPQALGKALIRHPNIQAHLEAMIDNIKPCDQQWQLSYQQAGATKTATADMVIIANAKDAQNFTQTSHLPVKAIRGQVTHAKGSATLTTVICAEGYVSPPVDGEYCFGATFDLKDPCESLRGIDHDKNHAQLQKAAPNIAAQLEAKDNWDGKVGFRCATPDYLPIAGPAPDLNAYLEQYQALRKDRKANVPSGIPPYWTGLFVNIGHGSKGLITAPLLAEHIASIACQEPSPLPRDIADATHPARFIIKDMIRKKL